MTTMTQLSLYTFLFIENEKHYLYNSQSNFLSEITPEFHRIIANGDWESLPAEVLDELFKQKVITDSNDVFDYYNTELIRFNSMNYDRSNMSLVLVPTTACNFACPYCFEPKKSPKTITDDVIDNLKDFIKGHDNTRNLHLTWYGGEPLVAFNKIKKIWSKLAEKGMPEIKSHSIITNGYLFTDEVVDFFKDKKLDKIQITIDGLKEHHDKTRCLLDSSPTFDTIISNIDRIVSGLPDTILDIRVNINKNNRSDFTDIYRMFTQRYKGNNNINVYPGIIREETADGCSLCPSSYSPGELQDLFNIFRKEGIEFPLFPSKKQKGCMMQALQAYIIGPEGEIYKCWNDVSDPDKIIGNISSDTLEGSPRYIKYMTQCSPFSDGCRECGIFPLCEGGCSLLRYKNRFGNGNFDLCSPLKNPEKLKYALLHGEIDVNK